MTGKILQINYVGSSLTCGRKRGHTKRVDSHGHIEAELSSIRDLTRSEEQYRRALHQAEAACRIAPDDGTYVNTLGVAHYRVGDYEAALKTLTRSDKLNAKRLGTSHPTDIAFLAMAHQKLGHSDEARQLLDRLRQLIQQEVNANADSPAFLREAEALIQPPVR